MNWKRTTAPGPGTGAGRGLRPVVLLAGALALSVAVVAVAAGRGGGHHGPRTYHDRVADRAADAAGGTGPGTSFEATGLPPSPSGGTGAAGGGTGPAGTGGAGQAAAGGGPAPAGTGSNGTGPAATGTTGAPAKATPTPTDPAGRTGPKPNPVAAAPGWRLLPPAPISGRIGHAAAWTGREMVVWGGQSDWDSPPGNDGAAYDPAAATWRRVGPAPLSGRSHSVAQWTGREVLIWGGVTDEGEPLSDGAAWDPGTNRWRKIAGSPLGARDGAAVVWAGDASPGAPGGGRLVVWGGLDWENGQERNDGAAYDPEADRWVPMASAPLSPRGFAQAGWTGSRVVISGGIASSKDDDLADGAAWDPATGRWTKVAARPAGGACTPEEDCVVAWTGTRLLLSGSRLAYDPAANRWDRLSGSPGEGERWLDESTVWTGSRMITWGGQPNQVDDQGVAVTGGLTGVVYDPRADRWSELEPAPMAARAGHTAVWTGQDMLVWGGSTADVGLADGAAYRPAG